jgi:hypothetical protein
LPIDQAVFFETTNSELPKGIEKPWAMALFSSLLALINALLTNSAGMFAISDFVSRLSVPSDSKKRNINKVK